MAHWVFKTAVGYVGTRKVAKGQHYTARVTLAPTIDEARVFNTPQAATNAGLHGGFKGEATKVRLILD